MGRIVALMDDWARQLRQAREAEGLSREALASVANVSAQTVKAYELGLRNPSQDLLIALLDALKADRSLRNSVLIGAGFAPDGAELGPQNDDYMFGLREAEESIRQRPWPAHVNNELMEVVAANEVAQKLWDVDLAREYNTPVQRNMLTVASTPRFADCVANWDEMVSVGISIMKGHHRGAEEVPEGTSQYFAAVMQLLFAGDPKYVTRFLTLWESVPPRSPKIWWSYPVVWVRDQAVLRFTATVSLANEQDGLYFHDWIPMDGATATALDEIKKS